MLEVTICHEFGGRRSAHPGFSLGVEFVAPQGITVLFGPSGSGKSSILRAIAGLLQPQRGRIIFGDQVFFDGARGVFIPPQGRRLGYVTQGYGLFPHLTVAENIGFGLHRWPASRRRERVRALVAQFALSSLVNLGIDQISGGQAQRVAIARALAPDPQLLLLDEPFSALDEDLRGYLQGELRQVQQRSQVPMILVTHSRREAIALADQVVQLAGGQVVAVGSGAILG